RIPAEFLWSDRQDAGARHEPRGVRVGARHRAVRARAVVDHDRRPPGVSLFLLQVPHPTSSSSRMGLLQSNPCEAIDRPKTIAHPPHGMSADDIKRLLDVIPNT